MAELPHLGQHCGFADCKQLDFLPVKCDACKQIYCSKHITYVSHECSSAYMKDVQVPVCPLCDQPVPVARGELPDIRVSQHIDRDCRSDPAVAKRKVYANRCSLAGCKKKELVPVTCAECRQNFCLKHRHTADHDCRGFQGSGRAISSAGASAVLRQQQLQSSQGKSTVAARAPGRSVQEIHGNMSEDEALAHALHLSLGGCDGMDGGESQEEADRRLAEQLQQREYSAIFQEC